MEFLKKEKNYWKNQQPKAVKRLVKYEKIERQMSKWTGLFCLFSADLWKFEKKKIEKLKNYIVRMPFRKKKKGKSSEISVKFENLE